jgi:hypothetical protein
VSNHQSRYRYPVIGLRDAVAKIEALFHKEHRNPMSPETVAHHIGYGSLNGASQRVIAALKKYGLLEGRGHDLVITTDAITIIADKDVQDQSDRAAALERALVSDSLFEELRNRFGDQVSEVNVTSYLVKKGLMPDSAKRACASFLDSVAFIKEELNGHNDSVQEEQASMVKTEHDKSGSGITREETRITQKESNQPLTLRNGEDFAVFTFDLDEGQAVIKWPRNLSIESVNDLESWLEVIMRKEKRKAMARSQETQDKE